VTDADTILIVDDDEGVRALAAEVFGGMGHRVLQASSGPAALLLLEANPDVSVLFTDVIMPGMSGQELADRARTRRPDLLVVMTSGFVKGTPIIDVPFVPKPWRVAELGRTLRGLLQSRP
jgi:CheY-like chemotaxis protein